MPAKNKTATPSIFGQRVREQREAVGMSVTKLAELVGVSRGTITNYEKGATEPTMSHLWLIANALGCNFESLLPSFEPEEVPSFAFRAHKALRSSPEIMVVARKYLQAYDDIEAITETRLGWRVPDLGTKRAEHDERWLEYAAERVRDACTLKDRGPDNIVRVLEDLGIRCLFFEHESQGLDAVSARQGESALVMLRRPRKNVERVVFSAAHELAHLVLHPDLFEARPRTKGVDKDAEREADFFAGCFLVPADTMRAVWESERLDRLAPVHALLLLKKVFRVSFWCLYRRAQHEGLIDVKYPTMINAVKRQMGIKGKARMEDLEPNPLPAEMLVQTSRFARLVRSAFLQQAISEGKVAEVFQVTVNEAKKITADWIVAGRELVE